MQKALELNGKKVMGQEVKLDRARSKENSQEGKKGKKLLSPSEMYIPTKLYLADKMLLLSSCHGVFLFFY